MDETTQQLPLETRREVVRALAANILETWSAVLMASMQNVPKGQEMYERMKEPKVGDLVVEITTSARADWPDQAIGILREIEVIPSYTPEQWEANCEHDAQRYEYLKTAPTSERMWGLDDYLLERGPRKVTDPIPTEKIYKIEPLIEGDHDTYAWQNCSFVAGLIDFRR